MIPVLTWIHCFSDAHGLEDVLAPVIWCYSNGPMGTQIMASLSSPHQDWYSPTRSSQAQFAAFPRDKHGPGEIDIPQIKS